jgi:hypothetical protein
MELIEIFDKILQIEKEINEIKNTYDRILRTNNFIIERLKAIEEEQCEMKCCIKK